MFAYLKGLSTLVQAAIGIALLAALAFAIWFAVIKPRSELAAEKLDHAATQAEFADAKAKHAAVLEQIAEDTAKMAEKAALLGSVLEKQRETDKETHRKEVASAYERGKSYAARIVSGDVSVRDVWRDRECPTPTAGEGAGPESWPSGVSWGRADAIGRVLGHGGRFDADYDLLWKRLGEAQERLNLCYEEPAP